MIKNPYKKQARTISFAYEKGYKALKYFDSINPRNFVGGKSGYVVNLILEDMKKRGIEIEIELDELETEDIENASDIEN